MRRRSLLNKTLTQFIACTIVLLLLATPLFYWLTEHYYAEDMIDIIRAAEGGQPLPTIDLKEDIMHGVMIQFMVISAVLGVAIVFMMRFIARRLWRPFDETLKQAEGFRLEKGMVPAMPDSDIREFDRLNHTLTLLMQNNLKSYRMQKEFTENASHELQTPLAVFQSKLDILFQQPGLTERQAMIIQDLYQTSSRLSRLNRNLLLLAKIDNRQYERMEEMDVNAVLDRILPMLECLAEGVTIRKQAEGDAPCIIRGNSVLFESLVNNLVVNAVRHNRAGGNITLMVSPHRLTVSNTSSEGALDKRLLFNRFYHPAEGSKGNGLGLAIVKAICDYHGWQIDYGWQDGRHTFSICFKQPTDDKDA